MSQTGPKVVVLIVMVLSQWLRQSLESWKTYYYEGDNDMPLVQAGRTLYHLGHISLAVNVRVLFTAAGSALLWGGAVV